MWLRAKLRGPRGLSTGNPSAGTQKAVLGGEARRILRWVTGRSWDGEGRTEGNLPPVMPQGNSVEVLGREVRQGSPGELIVESCPSRERRPPCKTKKEMSDEAVDAAALTYLLTQHSIVS